MSAGIDESTTQSSSAKVKSASNEIDLNAHLAVPRARQRRSSLESTFSGSDISELSFTSNLGSTFEPLVHTLSNVSAPLTHPTPNSWRTAFSNFWIANHGAFLVLVSQLFGCAMNIATRTLETPGAHGDPMHPFQILFVRQSITVTITTIYALTSHSVPAFPLGPPGKVRLLLISRGLFGFLGVFGIYFSLRYLTISESTILTFLGPVGACYAFSLLLSGETFNGQQQIASFISLLGVVFIARPLSLFGADEAQPPANRTGSDGNESTSSQHLQAIVVAMVGVIGNIGALTSIRAIGTRAHALISVNYFGAWCTFISLVAFLVLPGVTFRVPANAMEWGHLTVLGFAGFFMQLLLTKGMAYGGKSVEKSNDLEMQRAGKVMKPAKQIEGSGAKATSMLYTQMLFALISDKVVFGIMPDLWSWVGSGLILFGAVWVAAEGGRMRSNGKVDGLAAAGEPTKAGVQHEEEVGLLADRDEEGLELKEQGSGEVASGSARAQSS